MGRLTLEQWEQARAEYEVRGISLREVAKIFGVSDMAVRKKANKEGWEQGKSSHMVEKKVAIIKAAAEFEKESSQLPRTLQHTIDTVANEKLEEAGYTASFGKAIARRGIELAAKAKADELETLSRAHKNISPQVAKEPSSTTVNVNQQQAQGQQIQSPKDALAEIVEAAREDNGGDAS